MKWHCVYPHMKRNYLKLTNADALVGMSRTTSKTGLVLNFLMIMEASEKEDTPSWSLRHTVFKLTLNPHHQILHMNMARCLPAILMALTSPATWSIQIESRKVLLTSRRLRALRAL